MWDRHGDTLLIQGSAGYMRILAVLPTVLKMNPPTFREFVLTSSFDGTLSPSSKAEKIEGDHFQQDKIMLLITSVYLVNASRHRLNTSRYRATSGSIQLEKTFRESASGNCPPLRLMGVVLNRRRQPPTWLICHLSIKEGSRMTRSRRSSTSSSTRRRVCIEIDFEIRARTANNANFVKIQVFSLSCA